MFSYFYPTTLGSFQLVTSPISLENLLKRRSQSASCACKPLEYYFLQENGASRVWWYSN
jgi:hypothetical protein